MTQNKRRHTQSNPSRQSKKSLAELVGNHHRNMIKIVVGYSCDNCRFTHELAIRERMKSHLKDLQAWAKENAVEYTLTGKLLKDMKTKAVPLHWFKENK